MARKNLRKNCSKICGQREVASFMELFGGESWPPAINFAAFHVTAVVEYRARARIVADSHDEASSLHQRCPCIGRQTSLRFPQWHARRGFRIQRCAASQR